MARVRAPLLALGLALVAPTSAAAEVGVAEFSPKHLQQLVGLDDFTYDTDWFPVDSPVQLRLIVHAGNSVTIDMPGDGLYDWDQGAIHFEGEEGAGSYGVDVGFTLDAKVRFDVAGIKWESDIIGPYDYAVISETLFTPYLLMGNPDRPAVIADETDATTLVEVPITPDILVASGHLDIDIYLIVDGELSGRSIDVATLDPKVQWQSIKSEGEAAPLDAGPGPLPDPFEVEGVLYCDLATTATIVLRPTLVMEILGKEYIIADIDIPVALPPFEDVIQFDPIMMDFMRPPPPPEPATTSSDGASDSASGTGDASGTSGGAGETEGDTDGTGLGSATASGGFGEPGEEGCACRSGDGAPGGAALLALPILALARRRRARAR
ncbi:MAG: hypothetical protein H6711_02495 [Myxococcales bacterium]|nr:hypothetical protein [Myxococcales bacterium]